MDIEITRKQHAFVGSSAFETLFGGAAGGGKTYGQLVDALLYAGKYAGSKQLMLRRTFPELELTMIRESRKLYPREMAKYNESKHLWTFANGSTIQFGYCDNEGDVYNYQSAEFDVIRFDELTHFTEFMYTYLISRVRGANTFPRAVKSTTNPGGVGHVWVKARFIDPAPANTIFEGDAGTTRIFIPSRLDDNVFLTRNDPGYRQRLENLPESERQALLCGEWDIYEGVYFDEFRRDIHVVKPFPIPDHWRRYLAIDYGLDMLACYIAAVDPQGYAYVYKEYCQSNLVVSKASAAIKHLIGDDDIYAMYAPPDLRGRSRDSGKSQLELFADNGLHFQLADSDRESGWLNLKEWLKPVYDETGETIARVRFFETCPEIIRTLPALQRDKKKPSDCATEPHDITHSPDAIRYLFSRQPKPGIRTPDKYTERMFDEYESFLAYGR